MDSTPLPFPSERKVDTLKREETTSMHHEGARTVVVSTSMGLFTLFDFIGPIVERIFVSVAVVLLTSAAQAGVAYLLKRLAGTVRKG